MVPLPGVSLVHFLNYASLCPLSLCRKKSETFPFSFSLMVVLFNAMSVLTAESLFPVTMMFFSKWDPLVFKRPSLNPLAVQTVFPPKRNHGKGNRAVFVKQHSFWGYFYLLEI